jgi:hypothetical protein
MPVNREAMIDWIMNVPDDAEIGTDDEGVTLLAIRGRDVQWLAVGRLPYAKELYCEAINQAMMERLRRIHAEGGDTDEGVVIVTLEGYISGDGDLFVTDFYQSFLFKNREQAETFIAEFADELHSPQILDYP